MLCADLFSTLANPIRLMIIDVLRDGEKTVSEIARITGRSQSNISQHLSLLRQRGFVIAERRGTSTYYRLFSDKITNLCNLIREILYESLKEDKKLAEKLKSSIKV